MPSTRCGPPCPCVSIGDDAGSSATIRAAQPPAFSARDTPAQHPAGADRAAERVDPAAGLLDQLAADPHVAANRVGVVELIGPERVALGEHPLDLGAHPSNSGGVIFPPSLGDDEQIGAEGAHGIELLLRERIGRHQRRSGSP